MAVGAVSLRYPEGFHYGAFTNPNATLRRAAVALTVEGGRAAKALGAAELVVWSAFDGYDYPCQADYQAAWQRTVSQSRHMGGNMPRGGANHVTGEGIRLEGERVVWSAFDGYDYPCQAD
eukprot:187292-Prorocentrum_minimum.AAC.1